MLSLVSVKRITSDVPVCNVRPGELEITGERASGDRWLRNSAGGEAWLATDSLVESGYFQFHAAVLAPRLNPKADETIPARVKEAENQATDAGKTWETKTPSRLNTTAPGLRRNLYLPAIVNCAYQ
ncbi:hypothetical protein [Microcoleus sp. D3_18_C4]|uniref:hypothetical protein n=1 Tax=Microcoleus sp. D3_18_C4 TaxID=3055335 RepID=UPI002FD6705D